MLFAASRLLPSAAVRLPVAGVRLPAAATPLPRASSRLLSSAAPAKRAVTKPRAVKGVVVRSRGPLVAGSVFAAVAGGVGYMLYDPVKSPSELLDEYYSRLVQHFRDVADPDVSFMQNCLPPQPPLPPGFDMPTIFLSVEGVCMARKWDRKYGFRYLKRPGLEALLMTLTKQGFEIVFWTELPAASGEEALVRLVNSIPGQLSIAGLLGKDHMYIRDNKGEKRILHLPRDKANVVVVDHVRSSYDNQPDNTLIVPEMRDFDENDRVLYTLTAFASMYREERNKKNVSNIRSFIRQLKAAGGGDGDPSRMLEAFDTLVQQRKAARLEQETSGLGGVLRKVKDGSGSLAGGRAITTKTSKPNLAITPGSLMSEQRNKMKERMRRQQEMMKEKQKAAVEERAAGLK